MFIVASMLCSYLVIFQPPQQPAVPTAVPSSSTEIPRATDTPPAITPMPTETQTPTPSPTP